MNESEYLFRISLICLLHFLFRELFVSKIAVLLRGVPGFLDWMNTLLK